MENRDRVLVDAWDAPTRILHWVNMALVLALMLLMFGKTGMEAIGIEKALRKPVKELHSYIGHILVVTLFLRLLWGFVGNRYARWSDILPLKKENWQAIGQNIKWYLSGFKGSPAKAAGHDPLASLFYIALFIVLISQSFTGVVLSGLEFKTYPGILFAPANHESAEGIHELFEEIHEFGMLFMIFFIVAHLGGLIVHEVKEKTGLFSSMIHGRKYFRKD